MHLISLLKAPSAIAAALVLFSQDAAAHEAWLLTPSEVEALSRAPMPALFTSTFAMVAAAILGAVAALVALAAEDHYAPVEQRLTHRLCALAGRIGPVAIRIGLALMLALGAVGGLPRAGVALWSTPVLFVPDMQLALVPGWGWLGAAALITAVLLALGAATRIAAVGVLVLSGLGIVAFGTPFLSYAPHFAAPALMLLATGPGALAVDNLSELTRATALTERQRQGIWYLAMALVGGTFVYLGIAFKLLQPTLLIAILQHGQFPTFGLPIAIIALVMTGVEIVAGLLLALGRLVRPVAIFLIGAFTFFAVMLGETPLFHANLYGTALMLLMAGARAPRIITARQSRIGAAATAAE